MLLLAALVTGCSHSGQPTSPAIVLKRITADAQVVPPASTILFNTRDLQLFRRAYDIEMSRCTERAGHQLSYVPSDEPTWVRDLPVSPYSSQPFGAVDLARVSQFGYGDPLVTRSPVGISFEGAPTTAALMKSCDASVQRVFGGIPPKGISNLLFDADRSAGTDRRAQQARAAWRRCMARQGFKYESGIAAAFKFRGQPALTELEITTAVQDVRCQGTSRNIDTAVALTVAYESAAIEEHPNLFASFAAWKRAALHASDSIVGSHPLPRNRTETPALTAALRPTVHPKTMRMR